MKIDRYVANPAESSTEAEPGTAAKIAVMRSRVGRNESPFHPGDLLVDLRKYPAVLQTASMADLAGIFAESRGSVSDVRGS